jgi:hypothetical protein
MSTKKKPAAKSRRSSTATKPATKPATKSAKKSAKPVKFKEPTVADRLRWAKWEMTHLMAAPEKAERAVRGIFRKKKGAVLVAEGDSWFDYPPGFDVLDQLEDFGYKVHSVASAGATVEQMVYGPDNDQKMADFFKRDPSQLAETLRHIREEEPAAVLFSGGGNDIAGNELLPLLNHKNAGGDPLRMEMVNGLFNVTLKQGYRTFLGMVKEEAKRQGRTIPVIGHGYDYAIPDGRGVINVLGFHFLGPWLAPSLNKKGYNEAEGFPIICRLIDAQNNMIQSLRAEFSFFHPVELRGTLTKRSEWVNELHPTNAGFKKVAHKFWTKLDSLGVKAR